VAIRDGEGLFLTLTIRRSSDGDVYVLLPRDDKGWNPHASYHKSGQVHHKAWNRKLIPRKKLAPICQFKGAYNLYRQGISRDQHTAIGVRCEERDFDKVMEIPAQELSAAKFRTYLDVDLVEPGASIPLGARILQQWTLTDATPWVTVTFSC
jgi:hypothetical protein